MFPISSNTPAQLPPVTSVGETARVEGATVSAVGSALDAPPAASVTIDLSPVASFMMTLSQSRRELTRLQAAGANGAEPREAAGRAATLNETTQNVVNAFNLLPAVDFNQAQARSASLLNNLVRSLTQQSDAGGATRQQELARIGLTLQPPPLSDATGGLSLDNEILRASFDTDNERTTSTLQNTLDSFSELTTQFAEGLSAAEQASAAQLAAAQAAARAPTDPLRANPALAAAIAAYHISDPAALGANARAAQTPDTGIPRVAAVGAAARARGIGNPP